MVNYQRYTPCYYEACIEKPYNFNWLYVYEFPLDEKFCDVKSWSDVKLGKSCKYRMKFKDFKELESLALSTNRDIKLTELGID